MTLAPELQAILVCPKCKGTVEPVNDERFLACRACGIQYPVVDGIPVMLIDEAVPLHET